MGTRKRVFIPDKLNEDSLQILRAGGLDVDYRPGLQPEEKLAAVRDAAAVIVRSATRMTKELLDAAQCLELVVRAGVGVDNIDVEAATLKGVLVQNVPDGNVRSAAEHTIALILALARNIPQANLSMKEGKWERPSFQGVEVRGKTLGVVGLGKIGRHVAQMATGLGFQVIAYDPFVAPHVAEELKVRLVPKLPDLVSEVDFLTVHVPATAETRALIGSDELLHCKKGLRVINCARGGIVDEKALLEGLEDGRVSAAALDVFTEEPPGRTPLVEHPRVIVTPHLGASTREAQETVALVAAQQVVDYLVHRRLHSPVNAVTLEPELRDEIMPYHELAFRLGRLQAQLLDANPIRVVVKYWGDLFEERIQSYLTSSVLAGFLEGRAAQTVNVVNARALAKSQGLAVEERAEGKSRYFAALMKVEVQDGAGSRDVGGTIRGRRGLRLVSLGSYHFDAVLEGTLLICANEDRPGMIATLGGILAASQINISNMSLGRDRTGGTAISLVNLDDPCPPEVLDALRSQQGILWAKAVRIDG